MAPQSMSTALPPVVGITGAIAARRMPRMRLVIRVAPASKAPVDPAETRASALPSRSRVRPTPMEVSFLCRNTLEGSSHISTVSVVWTISIPRGMVSWPQSRSARRMASVSPVSSTSTPQCSMPSRAPFTISSGALSPPMASMMIFIVQNLLLQLLDNGQ